MFYTTNPQLVDARKDVQSPKKLATITVDKQLPDGNWSTSGRVNSCKVPLKVGCLLWENIQPQLARTWKEAEVFKRNCGDDRYSEHESQIQLFIYICFNSDDMNFAKIL